MSGFLKIEGKCHCGRYYFQIHPEYIKFGFASCHCSICRSIHSAPVVVWSGIKAEHRQYFQLYEKDMISNDLNKIEGSMSHYRTSPDCVRYFCGTCGTHLYIDYEKEGLTLEGDIVSPWVSEIHFSTALLDPRSLLLLEEAVKGMNKPRYLHVFFSDRTNVLGDLTEWANGPKYGGTTGLEPLHS